MLIRVECTIINTDHILLVEWNETSDITCGISIYLPYSNTTAPEDCNDRTSGELWFSLGKNPGKALLWWFTECDREEYESDRPFWTLDVVKAWRERDGAKGGLP